MNRTIRTGSRESELAMVQTRLVIDIVKGRHPELEFEIVSMKTSGDILLDQRLDTIGGKGLFIKELENALINGTIDLAVHSMKDMPVHMPEELVIAAVSKREDPRDVLVTAKGREKSLQELPAGAVIGTSSIRREVQLLEIRPDLCLKTLRGNVLTRMGKLHRQEYDALILAAAGLNRLGMKDSISGYFEIKEMIPAVGQGILGIETRKGYDAGYLLDSVHCEEAEVQLLAERAFMIRLNGGCSTPVAAHAVISGEEMKVYGMLAVEGRPGIIRADIKGNKYEAVRLGEMLADRILSIYGNCME